MLRRYFLVTIGIFGPLTIILSQNYFQQEVNHKIFVKLNDIKHELDGYESVQYINNSPDTLGYLFFHLWPNGYSDNNTELAKEIFRRDGKKKLFNDPELKGYIDSLDFEIEGRTARWNLLPGAPDIWRLMLKEPLKPGDTINITTPFHIKIPKGVTSRLGHIDESYQISQWYPKPAVYDKSGWHQMPYMDEGEFFSEYGDFDVSITLPDNYVVGATGNLQNEEEKAYLDVLSADSTWMKGTLSAEAGFPPSSDKLKTLRYTEKNIHDFAWFADKRFHVLKGRIKLPESGREVITWAMFTDQEAGLWKNSISYINNAIIHFSEWNGDYPYKNFTAVQSALNSGSGMEYPSLTVIGLVKDPYFLDEVLAHEICHSWFYSAIGSDERRFPFMDESLASAYESRYMELRYPGKKYWETALTNRKLARFFKIEDMPVQRIRELAWIIPARNNTEQAADLPSYEYNYDNYGNIIYNKTSQGFNYLRAYLGDSVFDTIMHDYYRKWKNRHPMPEDLRRVFESGTTKDLVWFFDDFLGTTKRLDYRIIRIENQKLLIKNMGELEAPVLISQMAGDSVVSESWEEGFKGKKWISMEPNNYDEVKVDPGHRMTELFRLNNNIRTTGIFPRSDPFQFQFLYTMEDPDKRYLEYLPAFDWNRTDGFMAGLAMHNGTQLPKTIKYFLMPFYSFTKNGFTGYGNISLNISPYNYFIRLASFSLEGTQFGAPGNQNYHKIKIGIDLSLTSDLFVKSINQKVFLYYFSASDLNRIEALKNATMLSYMQAGYLVERTGIVNPYKIAVSLESGKSHKKSSLEINYRYSYYGKNSGLDIRVFSGIMIQYNSSDPIYGFSAGGRGGPELYLFQGIYPDRFSRFPNTFWSRQVSFPEGGLVSSVSDSLGYGSWICSMSLTSNFPGKASRIPVKPFINMAVNDFSRRNSSKAMFSFEAGFKAGIWEVFEIYIPLFVSGNIDVLTGSFRNRIRFVFRLDRLMIPRFKT